MGTLRNSEETNFTDVYKTRENSSSENKYLIKLNRIMFLGKSFTNILND